MNRRHNCRAHHSEDGHAGRTRRGLPAFIDVMLAEWAMRTAADVHAGLANVDERSRASFGKTRRVHAQQQAEILEIWTTTGTAA